LSTDTPITLRIPGAPGALRLAVHGESDRHVSRRLREEGIWEPFETALFQAILEPGGTCVDVGANIGYFSVLAAALVGDAGRVFAFEPDPANCALLRHNANLNGHRERIEIVEGALAAADGRARLFLSPDNLGDHQLYAGDEARDSVDVTLLHGSTYLADRLDRLDLLKIDTQGTEHAVVAGLMPLLTSLRRGPRSRMTRIMVELTPYSLRQAGASGRELIELLAGLDQPMWIIDHLEHRLAASSAAELARWCDNVESWEGDRGFMNILVGDAPAGGQHGR